VKIVLDTNIIVSALNWGGKPKAVFDTITNGFNSLFVSDDTIAEIGDALHKPKLNLTQSQINSKINIIKKYGTKIPVPLEHKINNACRDFDDNIILECAMAAKADYIITGDKDLLVLKEYNGIKIITAKEYLEIVNL
jgi:putative PIN family toxin of toxin-antitoxin system